MEHRDVVDRVARKEARMVNAHWRRVTGWSGEVKARVAAEADLDRACAEGAARDHRVCIADHAVQEGARNLLLIRILVVRSRECPADLSRRSAVQRSIHLPPTQRRLG